MKKLAAITCAGISVALLLAVPAIAQDPSAAATRDARVGLRAGYTDAAEAAWNMRLVANAPRAAQLRQLCPAHLPRKPKRRREGDR